MAQVIWSAKEVLSHIWNVAFEEASTSIVFMVIKLNFDKKCDIGVVFMSDTFVKVRTIVDITWYQIE